MGNSSSTTNLIKNETNMSLTQKYVTNNIVETNTSSTNKNVIELSFGDVNGCTIDTSQSITSSLSVKSSLENQAVIELKNELNNSLQETLSQNASMVNGFAAATGGNETDTYNSIQNSISEVLDQSVTVNNIQKTTTESFNSNTGKLRMAICKNTVVRMDQNIVSNIVSQNILTNLQSALMGNSTINALVAHIDQKASQENQGLNNLVDSLGKALTSVIGAIAGPLAAMYIGGLCLLCVICIALLYFFLSPAGQNSSKILAQAGANAGKAYATGGLG